MYSLFWHPKMKCYASCCNQLVATGIKIGNSNKRRIPEAAQVKPISKHLRVLLYATVVSWD